MRNKNTVWIIAAIVVLVFLIGSGKIPLGEIFAASGISTERILPITYLNIPVELTVESSSPDIRATINGITWNITITDTNTTVGDSNLTGYHILVNNPRAGILNVYSPPYLYKVEIKRPVIKIKDNIPLSADIGSEYDFVITTMDPQNDLLDVDEVALIIKDPDNVQENYMLEGSGSSYKLHWKYAKSGIYYFEFSPKKPLFDTEIVKRQTNILQPEGIDYFWYVMGFGVLILLILIIRKRFFA